MEQIVGKCGLCAGHVIVPEHWLGPGPPRPVCLQCGALALEQLPTLVMQVESRASQGRRLRLVARAQGDTA
jgi:hypothetical protein